MKLPEVNIQWTPATIMAASGVILILLAVLVSIYQNAQDHVGSTGYFAIPSELVVIAVIIFVLAFFVRSAMGVPIE